MVEKMRLVNIVGMLDHFDEVVSEYIMDDEIELENPLSVYKSTPGFMPYTAQNPFEESMKRFIEVFEYAGIEYENIERHHEDFSPEDLNIFINTFDEQIHKLKNRVQEIQQQIDESQHIVDVLSPIMDANVHIDALVDMQYMKFRFGRMPLESYEKLDSYLNNLPAYFAVMTVEKNYVWGFYFVSPGAAKKVDHMFSTMYFERLRIDGDTSGTPAEIVERIREKIARLQTEIDELSVRIERTLAAEKQDLVRAFAGIKYYYELYQIKKFAPYTKNSFYLVGWQPKAKAEKLAKRAQDDPNLTVLVDKPEVAEHMTPPTKIRNWAIFRPFEDFIKMYGVPNYREMDPTAFLAIVYSLLFGMMFGDVGHGAILLAAGLVMTFLMKKGGFLAKVLIPLGLTSILFGFLYGTFFGFEGEHGIIKPLWFTPMENGANMIKILVITIGIGVGLIMLCMIFNIINGCRQKNWQKMLFSQNGLAGLIFYGLAMYCGIGAILGSKTPLAVAGIGIAVSLLLIFLQEPLGKLLNGCKKWIPEEKGNFFVQTFFETFEILLSFITNTISFVRVGAFALNHAGMMSVVVVFMQKLNIAGSVAVAIFGNLLVLGMEGLIVGIQVLRLGFYEMFGRFYDGDGRPFAPINQKNESE